MYRLLEILPGFLAWLTIILMFFLSWLTPAVVAIFIILFDVYWLFKTIYLSFHLRFAFSSMRENMRIDWLRKVLDIRGSEKIYHLIIVPMFKEPYGVIKDSFDALVKINYPKNKLMVVLGIEKRAGEHGIKVARQIEQEFGSVFFKFLVTVHPEDLPGEIPGKGSNETWAARQVQKIIDVEHIPYENVIVSVFDADTRVPPEYFGILTYNFLTCDKPQRSSFQPIPLFTNNIFQAPALARVISFSSTFWHMMQQVRPEQLTTFSSHSLPFRALVEVGFWNTGVVSEDSQIFWQFYLHFDGDWQVVPLFYPVSMDANAAPTFWATLKNVYRQQRRWAWGAENIPYAFYGFLKNGNIPVKKKIYWFFKKTEAFHSWATNALLIFALGWLPVILGGREFGVSVLSYNLPYITRDIVSLSMVGIMSSAVLGIILLPPRPEWFRPRHYLLYIFQWLLMPFTLIIFGSVPALEAQTRLMLGGRWRLGFWYTPKYRQKILK